MGNHTLSIIDVTFGMISNPTQFRSLAQRSLREKERCTGCVDFQVRLGFATRSWPGIRKLIARGLRWRSWRSRGSTLMKAFLGADTVAALARRGHRDFLRRVR